MQQPDETGTEAPEAGAEGGESEEAPEASFTLKKPRKASAQPPPEGENAAA